VRIALCHVRSGQFSKDKLRELQGVLQQNYAEQFAANGKLSCIWRVVPRGQGYTKSNINHVSWLMIEAPAGITMEQRHRALAALSLAGQNARVSAPPRIAEVIGTAHCGLTGAPLHFEEEEFAGGSSGSVPVHSSADRLAPFKSQSR
jgi:hypothetical protein